MGFSNRFGSINWRARVFILLTCLSVQASPASATLIEVMATPDNGTQPRLVNDQDGGLHLLYFKKRVNVPAAREGHLYYRKYLPNQRNWSSALRVSSQAFDMQTFSIARAAMAVDGAGGVHVLWYLPRESQYLYSRLPPGGAGFSEQMPVAEHFREGIDAGADIAAQGNQLAIVWGAGELSREDQRSVYGRLSRDNGATWEPEALLGDPAIGACACCALAGDYSEEGKLQVAYRSAIDGIGRHMQLLTLAKDAESQGEYSTVQSLQEWELSACPLSTNDIATANTTPWLAFETENRIVTMAMDGQSIATAIADAFTETRQKNPALARNPAGEMLVAWGEAISHARGGALNYRLFTMDSAGNIDRMITELNEPAAAIADYSFPAVGVLPGGDFLILH